MTGSGKRAQFAQAKIFAIYISDDRAKNRLRNGMHIPRSVSELWAFETEAGK